MKSTPMHRLVLILSLLFAGCGSTAAAMADFHTSPAASVLVCGGAMMNGDHFADSTLAAMRDHYAHCKKIVLVLTATPPAERDRMEVRLQ